MFFDPFLVLFSFGVGILGAMFGGIQTFICTGFAGIVVYVLKAAGVEPTLLGDTVLNTLLLPAIIFNGSALATAVAAKRHPGEIEGWNITRSLIFLHDTPVMLIGGIGGEPRLMAYPYAKATFQNSFRMPILLTFAIDSER